MTDTTVYKSCFECGSVYPTARALRQAYRKAHRAWCALRLCGLFVRASTITFCPDCLHEFPPVPRPQCVDCDCTSMVEANDSLMPCECDCHPPMVYLDEIESSRG